MRILIIEDERKTSALLSATLRQEGCEVLCAADGEAGLSEALKGGFDALLVDIMLPKLDGLSLVRALRAQGSHHAGHHALGPGRGGTARGGAGRWSR